MKFKTLTTAACLMIAIISTAQLNAQDLFNKTKKGGLTSAFTKPQTNGSIDLSSKNFSMTELDKYVESREFMEEKRMKNGNGYMLTYKHETWKFPVDVVFSKGKTRLWYTFYLSSIPQDVDPNECAAEFMKLMNANGSWGDYFFRYIPKTRRIVLIGAIHLDGPVTDETLDKQLDIMSKFAVASKDLWNTKTWADAPKHVGSWKSDSMTLKLTRSGQFELKTGSNTSTGSFKIVDGNMMMTEKNGEKINGTIQFTDANHFQLTVNGNQMKFVRM